MILSEALHSGLLVPTTSHICTKTKAVMFLRICASPFIELHEKGTYISLKQLRQCK